MKITWIFFFPWQHACGEMHASFLHYLYLEEINKFMIIQDVFLHFLHMSYSV